VFKIKLHSGLASSRVRSSARLQKLTNKTDVVSAWVYFSTRTMPWWVWDQWQHNKL